ncbi:uncharacterized protein A4U43_C03F16570 [Asparagus officinalis]|uniref:Uncharacterized protein n=1 Tax=Asparagus officinalis TaxID=4686 RepID=A0A5P1FFK3_ASPOF|nr:uncharacterized protein A4U43_C03F16570 [Asparagus officinalis]
MHADAVALRNASIWREASRIACEEGFRAFWRGNLVTIAHRLLPSAFMLTNATKMDMTTNERSIFKNTVKDKHVMVMSDFKIFKYEASNGVVRCPSAFAMIVSFPLSIAATADFVVPRSISTTFSFTMRRGRAVDRRSLRLDLEGLKKEKKTVFEEEKGFLEEGRGEDDVRSWNWAVDVDAIYRVWGI